LKKSRTRRKTGSYSRLLAELARSHPTLQASLHVAALNRAKRLAQYAGGDRFRGLEELIGHLGSLASAFKAHSELSKVAGLVWRARADFVTALEAFLSGFHSVVQDAMRDVMEIEFLIRDFVDKPTNIDRWLSREQPKAFRPWTLRKRYADRLRCEVKDLPETGDYNAHSTFLHVNPDRSPFGGPGLCSDQDAFSVDVCLFEIFEHALRLLLQLHALRRRIAPRLRAPTVRKGLRRVRRAWKSTQVLHMIFRGMIEVAAEESAGSGEDEGGFASRA